MRFRCGGLESPGSGAQDRECGSELKWDLVVTTGGQVFSNHLGRARVKGRREILGKHPKDSLIHSTNPPRSKQCSLEGSAVNVMMRSCLLELSLWQRLTITRQAMREDTW